MNQTKQVTRETEVEWQRRKRASGIGEHKKVKARRQMNQTEQVTSITGSDIDAAIQDERMIELERQINTLYAEAARQAKRIKQLERRAALNADEEQRLQVVTNAAVIREHSRRIEKLETSATINDGLIGHVAKLQYDAARQSKRIEHLEAEAALIEEQRLQVIANTAVIAEQAKLIRALRVQVATQATLVTAATRRIERLETEVGEAITALANGGTELDKRIEKLETCVVINAETIGQVELLKVAMVEQGMRIEKLEAVLETIPLLYSVAPAPYSIAPVPE